MELEKKERENVCKVNYLEGLLIFVVDWLRMYFFKDILID